MKFEPNIQSKNTGMMTSQLGMDLLIALRSQGHIDKSLISKLPVSDQAILITEIALRDVEFMRLEEQLPPECSNWTRLFCLCNRDLFANPPRALQAIDELEKDCDCKFTGQRLRIWRGHLHVMSGNINYGNELLEKHFSVGMPNSPWRLECYSISALAHYLSGRSKEAMAIHRACQDELDTSPELLIQTFNSSMAIRTALKLCDAENFEFFSQKLEEALKKKDDDRYRLRHTGYRAMILNQLGEHGVAERYWQQGDRIVSQTESPIERFQYLTLRGLAHCFVGNQAKGGHCFDEAEIALKKCGELSSYVAELKISRALGPIANPAHRALSLKQSISATFDAKDQLIRWAAEDKSYTKQYFVEAANFCEKILEGEQIPDRTSEERQNHSLALSIVENVSNSRIFASGLSHFRVIPNFVHSLNGLGLTGDGITQSLESVLGFRPILENDEYVLPHRMKDVAIMPEIQATLKLATQLLGLSKKADQLFTAQARLKEGNRAKYLLHDLKFFSNELQRFVSKNHATDLSKLSQNLEALVQGYLSSLKTGETPNAPILVELNSLIRQVVKTTTEIVGRSCSLKTPETPLFIWTSDTLLRRILTNLTKNGLEAGSTDSPVTISWKVESNCAGAFVNIEISDNGSGLNEEQLKEIRSESLQLKSTKSEGSGLGVKSAFECAKTIGGTISILKTGPQGTKVGIRLPIDLGERTKSAPKYLVVDDSEAVLEAWRSFGREGHIPIIAVKPENLDGVLNSHRSFLDWAVVDYDLKITGFTGVELASVISKFIPNVALSTGFSSNELPSQAKKFPFEAILTKEPQIPKKSKVKKINCETVSSGDEDALKAFRHDIKNELTPIKQGYRHLAKKADRHSKDEKALELILNGISRLEKMSERSYTYEN